MEVKDLETLELLLDKYSLSVLADSLAQIAYEKAEHIRSNWQDEPLAKAWERDGGVLATAANKIDDN